MTYAIRDALLSEGIDYDRARDLHAIFPMSLGAGEFHGNPDFLLTRIGHARALDVAEVNIKRLEAFLIRMDEIDKTSDEYVTMYRLRHAKAGTAYRGEIVIRDFLRQLIDLSKETK